MQITLCWYWMCKNQLQDFFKRILLGQKGVRQFLGSFFLIWEFSLKFPSSPAPRSSAVFPLRSERRWIVGTCRRELQVASGAWEILQGKPWASWGRFFSKNFMLAGLCSFVFCLRSECFIVQPWKPRNGSNAKMNFQGIHCLGLVVTPTKKLNGKVCGRFCIRFFYGTCHKGENCEFCHLEHKESKLKLDKVRRKISWKLFWCGLFKFTWRFHWRNPGNLCLEFSKGFLSCEEIFLPKATLSKILKRKKCDEIHRIWNQE